MTTPPSPTPRPARWRLGDWLIEPARNSLRLQTGGDDSERTLEPRVMAVLELLLKRSGSGEPVSDEVLLAEVWPGVAVSDASVYQAIAQLRKALGDSGKPYRYVGRVSGKGYYLLQPAEPVTDNVRETTAASDNGDVPTPTDATTPPFRKTHRWPAIVVVVAIAAVLGWFGLDRTSTPPLTHPAAVSETSSATIGDPVSATNTADTVGNNEARSDSPGWDDYLQGRWLWNQRKVDQFGEAADFFRSALKKDPTLAVAYVGLCDVFHFQHLYGDWSLQKVLAQCEPLLREALQREPNLGAALASFGLLKLSQGDLDAAESYLDRAIARNPKDAMALLWSGEVQRLRGNAVPALQRMRQAEALDPLSAIIKRNLYYTLASMGDVPAAQQMLDEALLLEPNYADSPIDEIEVRPLTIDRAVAFIQWAQRFPDRTATNDPKRGLGVQTNLAVVYLALRDFTAADAALKQAEAANPNHSYVLFVRAAWWRAKGDKQKALQLLQRRAELYPNNDYFRQVAYLQQSELTDAAAVRKAFEQEYPEYQAVITPPLRADNLRLLLLWLSMASEAERQQLTQPVNDLLQAQPLPERLALTLRLLVKDKTAPATLADLLKAGALISPADDYLLPEESPLWRNLDPSLLRQLQQNRERALQQLQR